MSNQKVNGNQSISSQNKETNNMEIKNVKDIKDIMQGMNVDLIADRDLQKYVKKTIQNWVDYSKIGCQKVVLSGGNYDICQDIEGVLDKEDMGMNKLTRQYREMAYKKVTSIAYLENTVYATNNLLTTVPFTDEVMLIDARELNNNLAESIAEAVTKHYLTVKYITDEKKAVLCFRTEVETDGDENGTMYLFIEIAPDGCHTKHFAVMPADDGTQKAAMVAYWKELKAKPGEIRTYGFDYAGPGNLRQGTYFVFRVHDGETRAQFMARIHDEFNYLTGGYIDTLGEKVNAHGGMEREKLFKANSRISLCWTPMTPLFSMTTFAYYNGSLGCGNEADGQWLFDAQVLADQRNLPVRGVLGLAYQARVIDGVINKGMAIGISHIDMAVVAGSYGASKQVSFKKFRELWIAGKLKKDTMYLVGGKCPQAIFDENSMKGVGTAPADGKFWFNILSVKDKSQGKLNIQDAMAIAHLPGAAEAIKKLGMEYADEVIENNIERVLRGELKDEYDYFDEDIAEAKKNGEKLEWTTHVVNPRQYFPGLVSDIAPKQAAHDSKIFTEIAKDTTRTLIRDFSKFNFEVKGDEYRTFQSDYAGMLLGKGVLKSHTIYMPGEKGGKTKTVDRCPKVDVYEFYRATTEWLRAILSDLEEMKKTDKRVNLITVTQHMFINADDSLIITPCDGVFKNATGGSDDDGDGGAVRGNETWNSVQLQQGDGSNTIPKPKKSGIVVDHYDIYVAQEMFIGGLYGQADANGNRMAPTPIGMVANHATVISALITGDEDVLELVLNEVVIPAVKALGYKSDGHAYERKFTDADVELHDDEIVEAVEDFYNSDLSIESFKNALADASRMGASVEGRVIDMAKTGELVHSGYLGVLEKKDLCGDPIKMRGGKKAKAYDTIKYEPVFMADEETGAITVSIRPTTFIDENKVILVRSSLSDVRDELLQYTLDKMNAYFALDINPSSFETQFMHGIADAGKNCVFMQELAMGKLVNNNITGNHDLSTDEKKIIREYLANTVRWMFKPGTPAYQKFFKLRKASETGKDHVTHSNFEYVLKEEYMQGVLWLAANNGWKVNNTLLGYKAFAADDDAVNDGDVVVFNHGSSDNGIVTDKHADGQWTMRRINGNLYATQTTDEYFAVPEVDDRIVMPACEYRPATMNTVSKGYKFHVGSLRGEDLNLRVGDLSVIYGDIADNPDAEPMVLYTPRCGNKNGKQLGVVMDFVYGGGSIKMTQVVQAKEKDQNGEDKEVTIVCGHRIEGNGQPHQNKSAVALKAALKKKITMPKFH